MTDQVGGGNRKIIPALNGDGSVGRPRYFKKIFMQFLVAAMTPAAGISLVYTALAGSALVREADSRLNSQASAFAQAVVSITDSCIRNLELIASDSIVQAALKSGVHADQEPGTTDAGGGASPARARNDSGTDPALSARALRRVLSSFPEPGSIAEASVIAIDGSVLLISGERPPDRDMDAFGSWGIFRALASATIAASPRTAVLSDGSAGSFTIGMAIEDDTGKRLGYALADIRRQAIANAAIGSGFQGGASLVFPSGKVVFDQSDPSREGSFIDIRTVSHKDHTEAIRATGAGTEFVILAESAEGLYEGFGRAARNVALAGLTAAAGLATALALRASASVTRPVLAMASSMKQVEAGDLSIRIVPSGDDELGDLARSFNTMTSEVDQLLKNEVERQELLRSAELRALAAQMNPHFLNNTLASIKSLAKLGRSSEIVEVVSRLGKILRAGTSLRDGMSTIGESMSLVRDYLSIEKVRFGDRFIFEIDIPPEMKDICIPSLILQPLAENALTHGLERKRGKGKLTISGTLQEGNAIIQFVDDGPGMEREKMELLSRQLEAAESPAGYHGMGLLGTNRRLVLAYGKSSGLRIGPASVVNSNCIKSDVALYNACTVNDEAGPAEHPETLPDGYAGAPVCPSGFSVAVFIPARRYDETSDHS